MRNSLKIIAMSLIWVLLFTVPLYAAEHSISFSFTAPTTEILNNDCAQVGTALTKPISYTAQWRVSGATNWNSVEITTTSHTFTGLLADTTYEIRVGAHYAGSAVFCFTAPVSAKTLPDQPPAACTNVTIGVIK